ncbi:SAM-dependent methyltransferase [bacterium]|nr:MAG: SAM-dependent methyltransferase [bacterium]
MNFVENETSQKLRGGYYTPSDLAGFIARWVGQGNPSSILEPSCGDGAFLTELAKCPSTASANIVAFELDRKEAGIASQRAKEHGLSASVHASDFLGWALDQLASSGTRFDAVVGNPPFIRYQYLPAEFQDRSERVFSRLNCKFTKHTNAWVPFILASFAMLKRGGRLAMVVPSEIIHVLHAQSLRSYLGKECRRLVIIDPEQLWFEDTLQGTVILLAEKRLCDSEKPEGVGIIPVRAREFVSCDPAEIFSTPKPINGKTVAGKWTRALLDKGSRDLLDELMEHPDVHCFEDIADVDVGIVTGANNFFLVTDEVVQQYKLKDHVHPMFGRSEHCPGVIYDTKQHRTNAQTGKPTNFIWFKNSSVTISSSVKSYIEIGEQQKLHTRYKCRVRSPWYSVPSIYATEIGMLKRSHDTPRLIFNRIGAYTTDTAYRIRSKGVSAQRLVTSFVNPLTALSAELEGRHYGGGVLELVPSEIEHLAIPLPAKTKLDIKKLDHAVRNESAVDVLSSHGFRVLEGLGLSKARSDQLLDNWIKLRNRRHRITSGQDSTAF